MTAKKQRSENWLEDDKFLLKELVRERVHILENKNTDTNTNSRKVAAWKDLHTSFNSMCKGGARSIAQLKTQWSGLKLNEKRKLSIERKLLIRTGGGPPASRDIPNADEISAWLPQEFHIDTNRFDSDAAAVDFEVENVIQACTVEAEGLIRNADVNAVTPVQEPSHSYEEIQDVSTRFASPTIPSSAPKPPKKRKIAKTTITPAEKIARTEMECRRELHKVQFQNELIKKENLLLKQALYKEKISYYKKLQE